jgi:GAF domain-containing protein
MGVPLIARGKIVGMLPLNCRRVAGFVQAEAALAQAFANQAAVAIENARLFEQVRAGREQLRLFTRQTGIGLLGMQDRLELLGGRLEIDSQPGQGTRLVAYAPWEESQ